MSPIHLIIISILGCGIGSFFYKGANSSIHPIMVATIATCVYIVITPLYFLFLKFDRNISTTGLIYSVLGAVFMCAGSMGYFYALRGGAAGQVTSLTALYPSITLLLSYMFMGEDLSVRKIIAILLAMTSAWLLSN